MSSVFKVLEGMAFPIVILDECSQLTEPISLLPISRFSCQQLVSFLFFSFFFILQFLKKNK